MNDSTTESKSCDMSSAGCGIAARIGAMSWWVTLVIAVIAVPLAGTAVALALTDNSFAQILVFILTCWACTWLGMWLMKKADSLNTPKS